MVKKKKGDVGTPELMINSEDDWINLKNKSGKNLPNFCMFSRVNLGSISYLLIKIYNIIASLFVSLVNTKYRRYLME